MRELDNRLKATLWHLAMMSVAAVVDVVIQQLTMFNMPDAVTVVLGILLAQLSKHLHNKYRK